MPDLQRILAQPHLLPLIPILPHSYQVYAQRGVDGGGRGGEFILIAVGVQGSKGKEGRISEMATLLPSNTSLLCSFEAIRSTSYLFLE